MQLTHDLYKLLSLESTKEPIIESLFNKFKDNTFIRYKDESFTYKDILNICKDIPLKNGVIETKQDNYRTTLEIITHLLKSKCFHPGPRPPANLELDSIFACLIKTSGSSGHPKMVQLTLSNLLYSAIGTNQFYGFDKSDSWTLNLPLHHVGGLMILIRAIVCGASISLCESKNIFEHSPSFISLVPSQLKVLLQQDESVAALKKMKGILLGGGPLSHELEETIHKLKLNVSNTFGMTETAAGVMGTPLGAKDLQVAQPFPYRELNLNQNNELVVSGPTLAYGYQGKESFNNHFKTNDLFEKSENGFIFKGRSDLIFQSGEENINPTHIESLFHHQITIIPKKDEIYGQAVCAFTNYKNRYQVYDTKEKATKIRHIFPYEYVLNPFNGVKPNRNNLKKFANNTHFFKKHTCIKYLYCHNKNGKPPLLFMHGFMGTMKDFLALAELLKNDFEVYSFDLPGHGINSNCEVKSLSHFYNELKNIVTHLGDDLSIYAYSMGGRILLNFLKENPLPYRHLFIESAHPGLTESPAKLSRYKRDQNLFKEVTNMQSFLNDWYNLELWGNIKSHKNFQEVLTLKDKASIPGWEMANKLFSAGILDEVKSLPENLTYITGRLDRKYTQLINSLKLNDHQIINECGHNVHFEKPQDIKDIVVQTLT